MEEKIKDIIKQKYGSVKEFSNKINVPYTTIDTIFKRGLQKANVQNVLSICKELNIDVDLLLDENKIVFKDDINIEFEELSSKEFESKVKKLLSQTNLDQKKKDTMVSILEMVCEGGEKE